MFTWRVAHGMEVQGVFDLFVVMIVPAALPRDTPDEGTLFFTLCYIDEFTCKAYESMRNIRTKIPLI